MADTQSTHLIPPPEPKQKQNKPQLPPKPQPSPKVEKKPTKPKPSPKPQTLPKPSPNPPASPKQQVKAEPQPQKITFQHVQPVAFFGVRKGKCPGVYENLQDCNNQTEGFTDAVYQVFESKAAAWEFVSGQKVNPNRQQAPCVYASGERQLHGKEGVAGVGIYFGPFHPLNISQRLTGSDHTINSSKIMAAVKAVQLIKNSGWTEGTVYSDSTYVINAVTKWMLKWKVNGWKTSVGEEVKNQKEFEELGRAVEGLSITWIHVTGENLPMGSREAKKLALAGLKLDPIS